MAFTARLCNPTPWPVEFNYELGVQITVPPFGDANLSMSQMDDFRPDKPGAENVQEELETLGVFLLDSDKSYESQALDALKKCQRRKSDLYQTVTKSHKDRAARQNITLDEESYKQVLKQMGMTRLNEQVATLRELIDEYESIVQKQSSEKRHRQFDPARTVFALPKPREFPSVVARDFFLKENPEVAVKETELRKQWEEATASE